jgi:hypothetical protein
LRVRGLPYSFRQRQRGESKLDTTIAWEFGVQLAAIMIGREALGTAAASNLMAAIAIRRLLMRPTPVAPSSGGGKESGSSAGCKNELGLALASRRRR